ncbi:hypothetical protein [Aromatoleum petrolei]|uniref:IrrE N-terminal-like domain-containing protein n=1 Tax=Aromatoleum petrolei TaxID=76116 RepID=A0ABX1MSQ5_9RHOO|nr:hypothetical protein [Aromatoleum petrolei]NMF90994.1 hypothetical protein [Aromatoleum petrolei]QTQ36752.1 Uncharacterized protein ToN1_26120 [Aromatoleum petrolei]
MEHLKHHRYIEYFQRQLVREGSEDFWHKQKEWFDENRSSIARKFLEISKQPEDTPNRWAEAIMGHTDHGDYDNVFAKQIFEPLVKKVLEICEAHDLAPRFAVRFVNSPGAEPSPAALPSSFEHVLFAGQGTFAFCNYWAKIFSSAMAEVAELPDEERESPAAVIAKLRKGQVLVDATRLAVHYARFESLLGFGRIEQPNELLGFRTLLLNAMEVFIVGHEFGHFISHEAHPDTCGIPDGADSKHHELDCDAVGLAVCTEYGVRESNAFAFQLIGPLLLFYALRTCEQTKAILFTETQESNSHPSNEERFRFALEFLISAGASDQVMESVHFALDVAMCVGSQVQLTAHELKESLLANRNA